ncbi:RabGAP/TBC [Aureobasidium pullulans EXF-150]|uniref:RabGAP/TBC n=2 Tax=Aureobasidium pullulans TaxID=5580 RepID=A0A074XG17_AURPU|nr:RabGAP/TBC [Aureobasidium pullulans EXF-150]KEQ84460.1 RabGAP/TBC [Aureobasidium pullulans EXF-150]THW52491.1 RabGAP/TBC [Aureobasidium pullulans]THW97836.1 RabGAP/TBC [Aureobasidium pullulans]
MRSLDEARVPWQTLQKFESLADLKEAIRNENEPDSVTKSRSLLWKIFLLFEGLDHSQWIQRSADSRSAYASVRSHLLRGLEHPEEVLGSNLDPLSEDSESPWAVLRQDEALRAEIMQDVDRCMPDNIYFRQPQTQVMLLDVLFVFCKLNPDVGYRQGMHELLAPILWVVEKDAVSGKATDDSGSEDKMLCHVFDSDFVEHDTFTLFGIVMQGAKSFYEQAAHKAPSKLTAGPTKPAATLENPILTRIHRIFDEYLPHVDPTLAQHLQEIDLIPQVFLMRWIRLLFGREFGFDDVLSMWDAIFADDPSLEIVDLVCLNMLLRLHWDLMDADYNTALTTLLRYPALEDGKTPQEFVTNAVYLRNNFNHEGASTLVEKYSGRPLPQPTETPTSTLQPSMPGKLRMQMPGRASSNFEDILQGAAKGVLQRGEKWGINKAFRDAMDEVRKGVREIQAVQTPQAPPRHTRGLSRQSGTSDRSTNPSLQLAMLEQRNTALSKMLKKAIDDLWAYHETAIGGKAGEEESLNGLSMAIAKVQFIQVYLDDATVPLSAEEEAIEAGKEDAIEVKEVQPQIKEPTSAHIDNKPAVQEAEEPADANAVEEQPKDHVEPTQQHKDAARANATKTTDIPLDFHTPRPTLAQSSFSWMLGQSPETSASNFAQAKALAPSDIRRRSKGFLFGDEDDARAGSPEKKKDSKRGKDRKKQVKKEVLFEQDPVEEEFDLGALEEEKKAGREKEKAKAEAQEGVKGK